MDDAVERRARALEEERKAEQAATEEAQRAKLLALAEFSEELIARHSAQTAYPIVIEPVERRPDRLSVVYFSQTAQGAVSKHVIAEVEAFHYGTPAIPVQIFERSPGSGERGVKGTLPRETAANVAVLVVEELAKAVAQGASIISVERAEEIREAEVRQRAMASAARQSEYDHAHRWDWLGNLLTVAVAILILRLFLYPWLRPMIEGWFN